MDVAHGGEKGCGRENADAWNGHEIPDSGDLITETLELVFEVGCLGLELSDLGEGLKKGVAEKAWDPVIVEGVVSVDQERPGALGNEDAELAEEPPDGIDTSGAAGEVPGAKPVEGRDGLLVQSFDGDADDVLVACGFEKGQGIGPIGLVSQPVPSDVGGREKRDLVAQGLKFPSPVVSGAAGLHEDMAGRPVKKEPPEAGTGEPMFFGDATRRRGHSDLKHGLCEIDGDVGSVHSDSFPGVGLWGR